MSATPTVHFLWQQTVARPAERKHAAVTRKKGSQLKNVDLMPAFPIYSPTPLTSRGTTAYMSKDQGKAKVF